MISTSANRKVKSRLVLSSNVAAVDPVVTLLSGMLAWWDSPSYSGTGNLLNKGTAGAGLDLTPRGGVSYAAGEFTLAADAQYLNTGDYAIPIGALATIGVIFTHTSQARDYGSYITGAGFQILNGPGTAMQAYGRWMGATMLFLPDSGTYAIGDKTMLAIQRMAGTQARTWRNMAGGTAVTDNSSPVTSWADVLSIGRNNGGSNPGRFKFHAAFIALTELTNTQLQAIATYYGVT